MLLPCRCVGYMSSEKAEIAKQYIIPSESARTGLTGKVCGVWACLLVCVCRSVWECGD